ncbi:hypothetical protein ABZ916_20395 [Streptomyces sp. NPDC046853]|uniref:hypothetical protein n=1 Tax=Streptomyces sp. NPDC046853 TaxID=3154920 RepID=UPI0033D83E5A
MSQPVEYAVAVERFLSGASLSTNSRRIYRIALTTWAWALADRPPPAGEERRNAAPPTLPLALLDTGHAVDRLQKALAARSATVGPRTANRELSVLVSAVGWWRAEGWLTGNPTARLRPLSVSAPPDEGARITTRQARDVLALPAPLREQTLWHLVYETGAPVERLLALDVDDLDVLRSRTLQRTSPPLRWGAGTARLLPLLVVGRLDGPLFVTSRGRLSYRRAAEIFKAATRAADPRGHGWTLHQFLLAGRQEGAR